MILLLTSCPQGLLAFHTRHPVAFAGLQTCTARRDRFRKLLSSVETKRSPFGTRFLRSALLGELASGHPPWFQFGREFIPPVQVVKRARNSEVGVGRNLNLGHHSSLKAFDYDAELEKWLRLFSSADGNFIPASVTTLASCQRQDRVRDGALHRSASVAPMKLANTINTRKKGTRHIVRVFARYPLQELCFNSCSFQSKLSEDQDSESQ